QPPQFAVDGGCRRPYFGILFGSTPEKQGSNHLSGGVAYIRDVFRDQLPDGASLLRCSSEKRPLGVRAVEIRHDRERFVEKEVTVLQRGDLPSRIHCQIFG